MSLTSTDGLSSVAMTATVPANSRTCSAVTSSKSRLLGASTVQRGMTDPSGATPSPLRTLYRVREKSRCIALPTAGPSMVPHPGQTRGTLGRPTRPFGKLVCLLFLGLAGVGIRIRLGAGVGVEPRQPGREAVHGRLELRVQVHEVPQPLSEPGHGDLLIAAPVAEFLDARVGEVHR